MKLLVFDVGGSHISGAVYDTELSGLAARSSVSIDSSSSEEEFYGAVQRLVSNVLTGAGLMIDAVEGMSFAFPGPFDYRDGVSLLTHKFASLHGKCLRNALARRFALEPSRVRFVNDADAFLLGEMSQMPTARAGRTVGITLGTGVGSAFAIHGEIVRRGDGVPNEGEIWDIPWLGGIVEDAISTRGIQQMYETRTGERRSVREIAERCPADYDALTVFEDFGRALGDVLQSVTSEFCPENVIFGGAISRSAELFLPHTAERFPTAKLHASTLFENAALYGAASHWQHEVLTAGHH